MGYGWERLDRRPVYIAILSSIVLGRFGLDLLPLSSSMVAELLYAGGAHIGSAFGQVQWVLPLHLLVPKWVFRFPATFVWRRPVILFL
jgi:hypothetical protein